MYKTNYKSFGYYTRTTSSDPWIAQTAAYSSTEEMASTNHFPLDTEVDDGGPWLLIKHSLDYTFAFEPMPSGFGNFYGNYSCSPSANGNVEPPSQISKSEMWARGATAIARSAPTNPLVNLASSGAESVSAGLGLSVPGYRTWRERTKLARSAGDEYLNVEFGWLPLVSDIRKTMYSVKHHTELVKAYVDGSDRKTRVGYRFPGQNDNAVLKNIVIQPFPAVAFNTFGVGTATFKTFEETWFSGCFKYHVPLGTDTASKLARYESLANHLLGTRITPEVLWNAAPWSWLADWFGNIGDVLHNISVLGHDGLVMQYGYIMNHRLQHFILEGTIGGRNVARFQIDEYKRRENATPYGFGFNMSALSSQQIAILTALGLTKGVPGFSH